MERISHGIDEDDPEQRRCSTIRQTRFDGMNQAIGSLNKGETILPATYLFGRLPLQTDVMTYFRHPTARRHQQN
jgi:hypothetical protein